MTLTVQQAIERGTSRTVRVLHVAGMPWAVSDGPVTLASSTRRVIFGHGLSSAGVYLADTMSVLPWLDKIGTQATTLREAEAELSGGDWSVEILDGQPGVTWPHTSREIWGLEGLAVSLDERGDAGINWWDLAGPLARDDTTTIPVVEKTIDTGDWNTARGANPKLVWIGQECISVSLGITGSMSILSRGCYRTRVQGHWPRQYFESEVGGTILADAPLGGIVNRPVHLWEVLVDSTNAVIGKPILVRHGRVSSRVELKEGTASFSVSPWWSYLDTKPRGLSPRLRMWGHQSERWTTQPAADLTGGTNYPVGDYKSGYGYSPGGLSGAHPPTWGAMQIIEMKQVDSLDYMTQVNLATGNNWPCNVVVYDPRERFIASGEWSQGNVGCVIPPNAVSWMIADLKAFLAEQHDVGNLACTYGVNDKGPYVETYNPLANYTDAETLTSYDARVAPISFCSGPLAWIMGFGYVDERWTVLDAQKRGTCAAYYDAWQYATAADTWEWSVNNFGGPELRSPDESPWDWAGVVHSSLRCIPGPRINTGQLGYFHSHLTDWTFSALNIASLSRDQLDSPIKWTEIDPNKALWGSRYRASWSLSRVDYHGREGLPTHGYNNKRFWVLPALYTDDVLVSSGYSGVLLDPSIDTSVLSGHLVTIGSQSDYFDVDESHATYGSLGTVTTVSGAGPQGTSFITPEWEYSSDAYDHRYAIKKIKDDDDGSTTWPQNITALGYWPGLAKADHDILCVGGGGELTGSKLTAWLRAVLGHSDPGGPSGDMWLAIPPWETVDIVPDAVDDDDSVCVGDTRIESIDWLGLEIACDAAPPWHHLVYDTRGEKTVKDLLRGVMQFLGYRIGWQWSSAKGNWHLTFDRGGVINASKALIYGTTIDQTHLLRGSPTQTSMSSGPILTGVKCEINFVDNEAKTKVNAGDASGYAATGGRASVSSIESRLTRVYQTDQAATLATLATHAGGLVSQYRSPRSSISCRLLGSRVFRCGVGSLVYISEDMARDPISSRPGIDRYGIITRLSDDRFERESIAVEISVASDASYGWAPSLYAGTSEEVSDDAVKLTDILDNEFSAANTGKDLWYFDCLSWQPGDTDPTARTCTCTDFAVDVYEAGDDAATAGADCYKDATISIDLVTGTAILTLVGIGLTWDHSKSHIVTYAGWDSPSLQSCQRPWLYLADDDAKLIDSAAAETQGRRWT